MPCILVRAVVGAALIAMAILPAAAPMAAETAAPVALSGAGATFPAPLYQKWLSAYAKDHPEVKIAYNVVGSGEGISRFVADAVDFGASDAALSAQDSDRVGRGVLLVPATAGLVVLAYNLPGIAAPLKLPRDVYVDILRGAITLWNDPRIKSANPGVTFPRRDIAVIARLDKSGTTYAMTNHLSAISDSWRAGPGVGTAIEWPHGTMLANGNEGVAARIKISEWSIGYIEYGFAKRLGLAMAQLQNKAGEFVAPDEASGQSALAEGATDMTDGKPVFITDPVNAGSYPMVTYSWLLLYKQYPDARKRAALKEFIAWGLTTGQGFAPPLGYIPLPASVVSQGKSALQSIR